MTTTLFDLPLLSDSSVLWESSAIVPVPRRARRWAKILLRREHPIRWGTFRRTRPLSANYGLERGTPVDRVYIERFLHAHAADIRGHVLEVRDPRYTLAYGGDRVTSSEIVDIDVGNEQATIVADLGAPDALPAGQFNCIIVTQTLQYIRHPGVAFENVGEALAPGGVVLVTAPSASRIDPHLAETDLWRFTPEGLADPPKRGLGGDRRRRLRQRTCLRRVPDGPRRRGSPHERAGRSRPSFPARGLRASTQARSLSSNLSRPRGGCVASRSTQPVSIQSGGRHRGIASWRL